MSFEHVTHVYVCVCLHVWGVCVNVTKDAECPRSHTLLKLDAHRIRWHLLFHGSIKTSVIVFFVLNLLTTNQESAPTQHRLKLPSSNWLSYYKLYIRECLHVG